MTDYFRELVNSWRKAFEIQILPPPPKASLDRLEDEVGSIPEDFRMLYSATNGLRAETFSVLPFYEENDPKKTWDSIERANDIARSRFLERDPELFARFLIFADIGGNRAAAYDKSDWSIWFENDEGLSQTDLSLTDFIQLLLEELADEG